MSEKETVLQKINQTQFKLDDIFFLMDDKSPLLKGRISDKMILLLEDALENVTRFKELVENTKQIISKLL